MQTDVLQQAAGGPLPMNLPQPNLILLKGAPGVGKSSTARWLAKHFPSGVRIEVDDLRNMVMRVQWTNQLEHRKVLGLSARLAAGFITEGFGPVVLIDTFSGDKLRQFLSTLRDNSPEVYPFVAGLYASDDVLRRRIENREPGGFRDLEVSSRINREVVADESSIDILIDTSLLTPEDVASAVITALAQSSGVSK
jgi:chloramphenicol 3-O-phosphotransferase